MWNAIDWGKAFAAASVAHDRESLRNLRRDVWSNTVEIVQVGGYEVGSARIDLPAAHAEASRQGTAYYRHTEELVVDPARRNQHRTVVSVHNADFLEIARAVATPECPAAVLNMASRSNPGGGVHHGSGAQEENLFRRSNAFCSLYQFVDYGQDEYRVPLNTAASYPIPRESGGIYSPGITVSARPNRPGTHSLFTRTG